MGSKFNLKRFKSIEGNLLMIDYANEFLERLGHGSSRVAFLLSGKYALKIAMNTKGYAQNEEELNVYTNPASKPVVARIYDSGENNSWLISDLVKPLGQGEANSEESTKEFEQITGVSWSDFGHYINWFVTNAGKNPKFDKVPQFVQQVIAMARSNDLLGGDLKKLSSWGKTPDGRCVLLDYGFSKSVQSSHYSDASKGTEKKTAAVTAANNGKRPLSTDDIDERGEEEELTPNAINFIKKIFQRQKSRASSDGRLALGELWETVFSGYAEAMGKSSDALKPAEKKRLQNSFERFFSQ